MQTQSFRKAILGRMALGLTLSTLAILSCGGDDDDDNIVTRQATLKGANERPDPRTTNGSGTAVLTINNDQTQIRYVLTYTGLTNVVQAHIHEGSADVAGLSSSTCARMARLKQTHRYHRQTAPQAPQ